MQTSRRAFLGSSLAGLACYGLGRHSAGGQIPPFQPFFLHVVIPNGFDNSYLFDARPLKFTQANWIQNYSEEESILVKDTQDRKAYFRPWAHSLWQSHKDKFSVLLGVHQSAGFDGHDQNMNQLFSGNPFGGNYFLNIADGKLEGLNSVSLGDFFPFSVVTNPENTLNVNYNTLKNLVDNSQGNSLMEVDPLDTLLSHHYLETSRSMSDGNWKMALKGFAGGVESIPSFKAKIQKMVLPNNPEAGRFEKLLSGVKTVFQSGLTQRLQLVITENDLKENENLFFDAHDSASCARYPEMAKILSERIGDVLQMLNTTPLFEGSSESLLSHTTVLISSEFGRTMRQLGSAINATGTDHNPYTGLCLVAGRGIKSGLILGETDAAALDENNQFSDLNGFHRIIDSNLLNVTGKGFDYQTGRSFNYLSEKIVRKEVLNIDAVVNTLVQAGQLPKEIIRLNDERLDPTPAPIIQTLLS